MNEAKVKDQTTPSANDSTDKQAINEHAGRSPAWKKFYERAAEIVKKER